MWFLHELKDQGYNAALTGIAVADKVSEPYHYIDSFRIQGNVFPLNFSQEAFVNAPIIEEREDENWKEKIIQGVIFKRDFKVG